MTQSRALAGFDKPNVSVLEISQAADMGMGSFYNLEVRGTLLDGLPAVNDPAETFARKFRLIGRMFRRRPQESLVLLSVGLGSLVSEQGFAKPFVTVGAAGEHAEHFAGPPKRGLRLSALAPRSSHC